MQDKLEILDLSNDQQKTFQLMIDNIDNSETNEKLQIDWNNLKPKALSTGIFIEKDKEFTLKKDFLEYMKSVFSGYDYEITNGMWSCIALIYFEQLSQLIIGDSSRYIVKESQRFQHLLKPAFDVYQFYNNDDEIDRGILNFILKECLFSQNTSNLYEIYKRTDIRYNRVFIHYCSLFHKLSGKDLSRLIVLYLQFHRTYDLYSLKIEELTELFDSAIGKERLKKLRPLVSYYVSI